MPIGIDGTNQATSTTMVTSISLTTTQYYDLIFLCVTTNAVDIASGPYVSGVSSANTTGWARQAWAQVTAGFQTIELWMGKALAPVSSESITISYVNTSTHFNYGTVDAFGVSGANYSSPIDASGWYTVSVSGSNATVTTSTPSLQTLLLGCYVFGSTASPTQGTGWTKLSGSGAGSYQLVEYQLVTTTQSGTTVPIGTGSGDSNAGLAGGILALIAVLPHVHFHRPLRVLPQKRLRRRRRPPSTTALAAPQRSPVPVPKPVRRRPRHKPPPKLRHLIRRWTASALPQTSPVPMPKPARHKPRRLPSRLRRLRQRIAAAIWTPPALPSFFPRLRQRKLRARPHLLRRPRRLAAATALAPPPPVLPGPLPRPRRRPPRRHPRLRRLRELIGAVLALPPVIPPITPPVASLPGNEWNFRVQQLLDQRRSNLASGMAEWRAEVIYLLGYYNLQTQFIQQANVPPPVAGGTVPLVGYRGGSGVLPQQSNFDPNRCATYLAIASIMHQHGIPGSPPVGVAPPRAEWQAFGYAYKGAW